MRSNPLDQDGSRGSITLIASTSGYFGGTGVVSYVASKHGIVGLARASQRVANQLDIRVNVVAPYFTPTYITGGYSEEWKKQGLPANTVEGVANTIVTTSSDPQKKGQHIMVSKTFPVLNNVEADEHQVAGQFVKEIEMARTVLTTQWLGEDIANAMVKGGKFFDDIGGYTLPKPRF